MLLALALAAPSFALPVAPPQEQGRRGWLGVSLDVEDGRDRPLSAGEVAEGSPAERAGLREGDRLIALEGRALDSYEALIELLVEYGPGHEVTLTARRALAVELDGRGWGEAGGPRLGVHLGQLDGGDGGDGTRWVVRQAEQGWPAARAGVQAGDRIVAVAGREPADFDELQAVLAEVAPSRALELVIERDLRVRLGQRPGESREPVDPFAPVPPGRFELVPEDGDLRLRLLPRAGTPAPVPPAEPRAGAAEFERQLREEIAGLNQELRALREELRTLRRELAGLRER